MRMALWCKIKKCRGQHWSWQQGNWRMFTSERMYVHTYTATNIGLCTHTHTFNGPFSATTRVSQYQNGKPIWILLKQETVSGSGSSWAICKSAYRSRQTTMPAPHHCFNRPDAFPAAQPTASKHWRKAVEAYVHIQKLTTQNIMPLAPSTGSAEA